MLAVAILAAGKGTRMKSALPKVLQTLAGTTLIERVLTSCNQLQAERMLLILGHQAELLEQKLEAYTELEFILQQPQNGTGHAVQQLVNALKDFQGELLVLNGDVPLLRPETVKNLVEQHRSNNASVTLLSTRITNPKGYGRIFTNKQGQVSQIIEDRDCTVQQLKNTLVNAGVYCFDWNALVNVLPKLSARNDQKELYLTDTIDMLPTAMHIEVDNSEEVVGINTRQQLSQCEELIQKRLREYWMGEGVTFIDSSSCTLSENCQFGRDVTIEPQTHIRGHCQIGHRCLLGPGSFIQNSDLGEEVKVLKSVIIDAKIGNNVAIGPFAHVRPETSVADNCRIGNFVEIKKSVIGQSSNVSHLSYIGDAKIGQEVNIGAGTITANFDGINKHQTYIGDFSRTGANSVLVAPIILGSGVTVGAGSTLTKDVPNGSLAIERSKQITKGNWPRQQKNHS